MKNIKEMSLVEGLKIYNTDQMEWIRLGLLDNLDVSLYANPIYNFRQMEEIREGLNDNLNVSLYDNPN